jgi:hypothetical protein
MSAQLVAILGVIATVVVGVVGPLLTFALTRRKSEAETRRTEVDTLGVVIDRLEAENDRLSRELDRARGEPHPQGGPPP